MTDFYFCCIIKPMNKKRKNNQRCRVYLDNAATTPVDEAVFEKMKPYFSKQYGNPSSIHSLGEEAKQAVEKARKQMAGFLGSQASEIIFTSGATESNNLIIQGVVKSFKFPARIATRNVAGGQVPSFKIPHIITSSIEHSSVLNVCQALKKEGVAEFTLVSVSKEGLINPSDVRKALKKNTVLVSLIYANNEIGAIQPIKEISQIIKKAKKDAGWPLFHTDAVQAVNYLNCRVNYLGVDSLTFNAHKIYGPKGIGVLYLKQNSPVSLLMYGGDQEFNLRPGTENTAAIVGLAEAIKKIKGQKSKNKNIEKLRDKLIKQVLKNIPESQVNGSLKRRLPNNANFTFKRAEGESIVFSLSEKGIAASTGSACSSQTLKPSQTLTAIGLSPIASHCSVRFSLGKETTNQDINYVIKILPNIIKRLRVISGR